ncbi:lycopene cyclase domain-containing protein [Mycobacterium sp. MYCO198283]|uniref:lycopene cyclase domain-containing protein n=1 Tax=Mycobacterium sp. MYCO198283 TaxID=2883505 RepID=UPI001E500F60|nr:lycopene cyclase domain-containing protein [Mycobacterium sp. MYCO198283]MCG5434482.1 lycopene cyclase domain-containing protein [Mycobacterium sp. MYCO198283]
MDRWHYFLVLGACLLVTAPLELFGRGVYRQPVRLMRALVPVAVVFLVWDALAIVAGVWWYNPRFVSGIDLALMPLEEVLFFVVIPLCGLLTYNAVGSSLSFLRGRRHVRSEQPR